MQRESPKLQKTMLGVFMLGAFVPALFKIGFQHLQHPIVWREKTGSPKRKPAYVLAISILTWQPWREWSRCILCQLAIYLEYRGFGRKALGLRKRVGT